MSAEKAPAFAVTGPRLAMAVAMITIGMFFWNAGKDYLWQKFELQAAKEYIVEDKAQDKAMAETLNKLDKKVDRLTQIVTGKGDPLENQAWHFLVPDDQ